MTGFNFKELLSKTDLRETGFENSKWKELAHVLPNVILWH
jgi:hypothetical protein